ncbi:histidine phosphatase family protein [Porticoccaceae bacterium LTM1]|nr:histidine phosphatase family protein [Porticoccaceae bacterium LTM1]
MKELLLIRHAKSSWKDESLPDIERPLNKRGFANAPMMGERLRESGVEIDRFYASPALRSRTTAEMIVEQLDDRRLTIEVISSLYTFNYEELLCWVRSLDDSLQRVAMVCHNPAVTDLTNFLALTHIGNIPTCGIVTLGMKVNSWRDAGAGMAVLEEYDYPKRDRDNLEPCLVSGE